MRWQLAFNLSVSAYLMARVGVAAPTAASVEEQPQRGELEPVAPHLVEAGPFSLPSERHEVGGVVHCALTVDAEGRVAEVIVLKGISAVVDEAVRQALLSSRFSPAKVGGQFVASRIGFDFIVEPGKSGAPEVAEPIREDATSPDESALSAPMISPPNEVKTEKEGPVKVEPLLEYGDEARVDVPETEPASRGAPASVLRQVAGANGDVLRAIEAFPGVTRAGSTGGAPLLRGAAWHESLVLIDDVPMPLLYHMGGLKSVYNSLLVDRVNVSPSNYSSRYGRVAGGAIQVVPRDPATDRFHVAVDLSLLDMMALAEGPLSSSASWAIAARRSNIDFVFSQFAGDYGFSTVSAPVYWDYHAVGALKLGAGQTLRLTAYGARDGIKLLFSEPSELDPAIQGDVSMVLEAHRVGARIEGNLGHTGHQKIQLTVGRQDATQDIGELRSNYRMYEIFARADWSFHLNDRIWLDTGIDHSSMQLQGVYAGSTIPQAEGDYTHSDTSLAAQTMVHYKLASRWWHRPAGYVQMRFYPGANVTVTPGVRIDYYSELNEATLDPRLNVRWDVTPSTAFKWGIGRYSQPPQYYESLPGIGNPRLDPFSALQVTMGLEQKFKHWLELGLEAFAKRITHRVVSSSDGSDVPLVNDGIGRVYGGELWLRLSLEHTQGSLAYTLMRSERRDRNEPWRPYEAEQPHVLVATLSRELGRGFRLGARLRIASGTPVTPIIGSTYDGGLDQYRPRYGTPFSSRNPMQEQLDVRFDKSWQFGWMKLTAYLDVQNVTNRSNSEGYQYSYDYSERKAAASIPLFPNLGITGEL